VAVRRGFANLHAVCSSRRSFAIRMTATAARGRQEELRQLKIATRLAHNREAVHCLILQIEGIEASVLSGRLGGSDGGKANSLPVVEFYPTRASLGVLPFLCLGIRERCRPEETDGEEC
jgi:hypothetical protein